MKKFTLQNLILVVAVIGALFVTSCGDDEESLKAPEASFTTEIDGKTVVFTNTSVAEEATYSWDFGDGESSAEPSPSHTYVANGSYIVSLTVTNESGSDDSESVLEIINIAIDGDFADWDDVPAAISFSDGEGGIALELKVENLEDNKLFLYIKTTSDDPTGGFADLYINSDNDGTTGFSTSYWPETPGFDVLIEGFLTSASAEAGYFYGKYAPDEETDPAHELFTWEQLTPSSTFLEGSDQIDVSGGKAFEFSIAISEFPGGLVPTDVIKIGMDFIDTTDGGWLPKAGNFPEVEQETSAAYEYTLK